MTSEQAKPPIGIEPEWFWRATRLDALLLAMRRYTTSAEYPPAMREWLDEATGHFLYLNARQSTDLEPR